VLAQPDHVLLCLLARLALLPQVAGALLQLLVG
jgi:hypothetical protein